MRKYDKKNKTNFAIVSAVCILILLAFGFFIKRVYDTGKKEYVINSNSVLYDKEMNKLLLDDTGLIKIKWSGAYYLKYKDKDIALDKQVVVFNNATKNINLYGTIYKINMDETIDTLRDETIIEETIIPKFYKLADRKYLLVAPTIRNEKGDFRADNYLIVHLDKMGNAELYNNKINMKTLTPTKLVTPTYTFDIANEKLDYSGTIIDLRKIIGSTNLYKEAKESVESTESGSGSGSGSGGSSSSSNSQNTTNNSSSSNSSRNSSSNRNSNSSSSSASTDNNSSVVDNKVYQDKNFSVVKNTIGTDTLSVDYSIYDPKNEYKSVYMEITDVNSGNKESYYLAKNSNNILIRGLKPLTKYNVVYNYSYLDDNRGLVYDTFNTSYTITTLLPNTTIIVSKLTNKEVIYSIKEDQALMQGAKVELYLDDEYKESYTFTSNSLESAFTGRFNLSNYDNFSYLTLKCTEIRYASGTVNIDLSIKEKN